MKKKGGGCGEIRRDWQGKDDGGVSAVRKSARRRGQGRSPQGPRRARRLDRGEHRSIISPAAGARSIQGAFGRLPRAPERPAAEEFWILIQPVMIVIAGACGWLTNRSGAYTAGGRDAGALLATMYTSAHLQSIVARVQGHVRRLERQCPGILRAAARVHAAGRRQRAWPAWCYLPIIAGYNLVRGERPHHDPLFSVLAPEVATLSAWWATQGIYLFDPGLFDALTRYPIEGRLPPADYLRLPEWAIYAPLPQDSHLPDGRVVHGVFASLQRPAPHENDAILMMFDLGTPEHLSLAPLLVRLGCPLTDSVNMATEAVRACNRSDALPLATRRAAGLANVVATLQTRVPAILSLVLYLGSRKPDLVAAPDLLAASSPHNATSPQHAEAIVPKAWYVGHQIGPTLLADARIRTSSSPGKGMHASPRPHVRPAHWQHYWYGRRSQPETRHTQLLWKPPCLVNASDGRPIVPTIRPVRGQDEPLKAS